MTRKEMKNYKLCSDVTPDECYIGGKYCASCKYAFPGNALLYTMHTDVKPEDPDICECCKK